jgi:hypothetical protein
MTIASRQGAAKQPNGQITPKPVKSALKDVPYPAGTSQRHNSARLTQLRGDSRSLRTRCDLGDSVARSRNCIHPSLRAKRSNPSIPTPRYGLDCFASSSITDRVLLDDGHASAFARLATADKSLCSPCKTANCVARRASPILCNGCDKTTRRANQSKSLSIPSRKNIPLNVSGKSAA